MTYDITVLNKPKLKPGLTYTILQNEYFKNRVIIKASGTKERPITIQATPNTIISDKTTINIKGSWIIFQGFTFRNLTSTKPIRLEGNHIRFTKNIIEEHMTDIESLITNTGQFNRIDNNTFRTMSFNGNCIQVGIDKKHPSFCIIDNNSFSDRFHKDDSKETEIINLGDKKSSLYQGKNIIYNNKFSSCQNIINVECCSNIISNNQLSRCEGLITLRRGKNNQVSHNYINSGDVEGGGISIYDTDHILMNNTFEQLTSEDPNKSPISIMCGTDKVSIQDNDFINCFNCFAIGVGTKVKPKNLTITENRIIKCNYLFNKKTKGYNPENCSITNNPLFNRDQRLRLKTGLNPDNIDIEKFYKHLNLNDVYQNPVPSIRLPPPQQLTRDPVRDDLYKNKLDRLKKLLKLKQDLAKEISNMYKKIKNLQDEINKLI